LKYATSKRPLPSKFNAWMRRFRKGRLVQNTIRLSS
jgi:hypothetical protein